MPIEDFIKIALPMPISVNVAYAWWWRWRRHKSNEYQKWLDIADEIMQEQNDYRITGNSWLEVEYTYFFPIYNQDWSIKKKDVFNFEKVLSDFLTKKIEGFKDEKIKKWTIEKIDSTRDEVEIIIREIL